MAIQSIDTTNYISSAKTALTNTGLVITYHYEDASNLIFTISGFTGHYRIYNTSNSTNKFYVGTGWTSGSSLDGQVQISEYSNGSASAVLVDSAAALCLLGTSNGTGSIHSLIICNDATDSTKTYVLAFCSSASASYNNSYCYDATNMVQVMPALRSISALTDTNGYVYAIDCPISVPTGAVKSAALNGVKIITKPHGNNEYDVYGDDVVVEGAYTSDGSVHSYSAILIVGGNL